MSTEVTGNKRRGWIALIAGVFIILLMGGCWAYVAWLLASHGMPQSPADSKFIGKTYAAFGLVILSGILGTINGAMMIRSGTRSRALTFATVVTFVAALLLAVFGLGSERTP
jgi:hypothetical protein